ncbi:MAG: TonB-dependent receptor [Sphingomonas bacterium]|uniref:TonB-dependent receptor plug domain-containing protein n=1 Tax=Sphingomonas bacterium TaxID=1895847 RepID=UPI00263524B1|nr:TonB-dependent receptor plug domain-containing protein [Sphingomonas bacterium]MDB5695406.1 TonB-dependent receptor [Sphingomonas bacterium]
MTTTLLRFASVSLLALAASATAQTPPVPAPQADAAPVTRTYLPADFTRFAPKTAFDMLAQVPGFSIVEAEQERGLGQASENVLINGQRIADKSGGAVGQLRKLPAAQVERIEIVEAATLGLAGLTGQVANVVVKAARTGSGQFEWQPDFRAHYARPNLFRGSASYTGRSGAIDYTLSVDNQAGRGAFGGPVLITGPDGALIERREEVLHNESDLVTFKTRFGLDGPGSMTARLTLSVTPYWAPGFTSDRRVRADGDDRTRITRSQLTGSLYDINGEVDMALGSGRLKLIGIRHYDFEPRETTQITSFDSGVPAAGIRLNRTSFIGETIGRAEYGWNGGRNAWQLSLERAVNVLDQRGRLAGLTPAGGFDPLPFPGGTGEVREVRYEATGTLSRPLTPKLDLQLVLGAEQSSLARVDGDGAARRFFRPKGSASLAWRPTKGTDASLKLSRRVGQISFYDFLSQPNLTQDRENAGNPDLVPPQSWELEGQVARELGRWGKTRLRAYGHRVEDIIDIVPIGATGEGVGNLPSATRLGVESVSTLQFDPLGWSGARLDATIGFVRTRVRDPLTGDQRPISGTRDAYVKLEFRRDVPGSPLAWGGSASYDHNARHFRLSEVFRSWEGPVFDSLFVEHKDVLGLTVRAQVANLLNARHRLDRFVYAGRRNTSPLLFRQEADQLIGPIFQFLVRGSF